MRRMGILAAVVGLVMVLASNPVLAADAIHAKGDLADLHPDFADVSDGAWASVTAVRSLGQTMVVLNIKGLDRTSAGVEYGAHVHIGPCIAGNGSAALGHYNVTGQPPTSISPETEIWLDFTVTEGGTGHATAIVPFEIPDGGAQSIVIHAMATNHQTGAAGIRLACIGVSF
jgi:Cu/Zn superoxide dismutase